jgi:hypothetical protein
MKEAIKSTSVVEKRLAHEHTGFRCSSLCWVFLRKSIAHLIRSLD